MRTCLRPAIIPKSRKVKGLVGILYQTLRHFIGLVRNLAKKTCRLNIGGKLLNSSR